MIHIKYDKRRLLEEATGFSVAEYLGMDVVKRGKYYFIQCPGHMKQMGKYDRVKSNCILTNKGYKCYACGAEGNVITMVQEYYEYILGTPIPFAEVLGIIGDSLGGRKQFLISGEEVNVQQIHLSKQDYELIGLSQTYYFDEIVNATRNKTDDTLLYKKSKDFETSGIYLVYEKGKISMVTLMNECPELYLSLIRQYSKTAAQKYKRLINDYCNRDSSKVRELKEYSENGIIEDEILIGLRKRFTEKYNRAMEIYNEACCEDEEMADTTDFVESEDHKDSNGTVKNKKIKKPKIDYYEMFG